MSKNIITPLYITPKMPRKEESVQNIQEFYEPFLTDESRLSPQWPTVIYFPRNTSEVVGAVLDAGTRNLPLTISSGRTGVVGGATCYGTHSHLVLDNLERIFNLNKETKILEVSGNYKLLEIEKLLPSNLIYPPDPTEKSATIGGTIATNASGARSFYYGPTRCWISGIEVVLSDGGILNIDRGQYRSEDGKFIINFKSGRREIRLTDIVRKVKKSTVGYYTRKDMDLVDLFIGSEGTLGVITKARLKLTSPFPYYLYTFLFLKNTYIPNFISELKEKLPDSLLAVEYMDENSLLLLKENSEFYFLPSDVKDAIYLEIFAENSDQLLQKAKILQRFLEEKGEDPDSSWVGDSSQTLREMKFFRHALPEKVNTIIGERKKKNTGLTKISTDIVVPDDKFAELYDLYKKKMQESYLEHVLFGHIGDNHLHLNILPRNVEEKKYAWEIYYEFVKKGIELGGVFSGEHGVGKIKKKFFNWQFSPEEIKVMWGIKKAMDPEGLFSPQNIFPEEDKK